MTLERIGMTTRLSSIAWFLEKRQRASTSARDLRSAEYSACGRAERQFRLEPAWGLPCAKAWRLIAWRTMSVSRSQRIVVLELKVFLMRIFWRKGFHHGVAY